MTNETEELVNENEVESIEVEEAPVETNDDDEHGEVPNDAVNAEEDSSGDDKIEEDIDPDPEWWKTEESRNRVAATIRRKATEKATKKAEEKAFKEAYEQAMSDFQETSAQFFQQNPAQVNETQQPTSEEPYIDQQQAIANQSSLIRQRHIATLGKRKYSDWDEKVGNAVYRAQYEANGGDATLASIIAEATNMAGNSEDLVYKLATDPTVVNNIRRLNPAFWKDELHKITQKPKSQPKIANKPVRELKSPPTSGGGETSMDDLFNNAFKKAYGK